MVYVVGEIRTLSTKNVKILLIAITLIFFVLHIYYFFISIIYPGELIEIKVLKLKGVYTRLFYFSLIVCDLLIISTVYIGIKHGNTGFYGIKYIIMFLASLYTLNIPVLAYILYERMKK